MKLIAILLIAVAWAKANAQTADTLYRFETTYQSAGNYHGSIFGLSSDVPLGRTTKLLPRAENLTRTFDGGPSFNETTMSLDLAQKLSRHWYLLTGASDTPNAVLNPQWNVRFDPHYASGRSDFGLRFVYSSYVDEKAGMIVPSWLYAFTDDFMISELVPCARADQWYVSSATQFIYKPVRRAMVRLTPSFGRTLESAGAPATFQSIALEASYNVWRRVRLGVGGQAYSSTLRKENSILFRIEAW